MDLGLGITLGLKDLFSGPAKNVTNGMRNIEKESTKVVGGFDKINGSLRGVTVNGFEKITGSLRDVSSKGFDKINGSLQDLSSQGLNRVEEGLKEVGAKGFPKLTGTMREADGATKGITGSFGKMNDMMHAFAGAAVFEHAKRVLVDMVAPANEFQHQMSQIKTRMNETGMSIEQIGSKILDTSVKFGSSASEQASAMFQLLDDGVATSADAFIVLEQANKLSAAGVVDLTTSVKALTDSMNAWGLSAKDAGHIAEVFLKTDLKGAGIGVQELARFMQVAAPAAADVGVSIEEVGAIIAGMTSHGVKAQRAFRSIDSVLSALKNNSKDLAPVMKAAGFESVEAMIKQRGFVDTLQRLIKASHGSDEALQKIGLSFSQLKYFASITGKEFGDFNDILKDMKDDTGVLEQRFKEATGDSSMQWRILKASIESVGIQLGGQLLQTLGPVIIKMTEWGKKLAAWMTEHPKAAKAIAIVIGVVAALGVALGAVAVVAGALAVVFSPIGIIFLKVAAVIGIVIGAVLALKYGIERLMESNSSTAEAIKSAWASVSSFVSDVALVFRHDIVPAIQVVGAVAWDVFNTLVVQPLKTVIEVLGSIYDWFKQIIVAIDEFTNKFAFLKEAKEIMKDAAWNSIPGVGAYNLIKGRAGTIRDEQAAEIIKNTDLSTVRNPAVQGAGAPPITNVINMPQSKIETSTVNIDKKKVGEIIFNMQQLSTVRAEV